MDPSTYGDRIADVYDDWYAGATDVEGTVATVKRLAASVANGRQGSVLELGIGTGRIAIALLDAGLDVAGIDASAAMVERLREKVGDRIPVTVANFVDVPVERSFDVALLSFNALLNLTTVDEQRRCLARCGEVATHVVVETFVPGDAAPPVRCGGHPTGCRTAPSATGAWRRPPRAASASSPRGRGSRAR